MWMRFAFFHGVSSLTGIQPKSRLSFSNGFNQVIFNLPVTLFLFMSIVLSFIFYEVFYGMETVAF
jgi:hypothetical protein